MKKVLISLILLLTAFLCGCKIANTEKISLGDVPPKVVGIDEDPYLDPEIDCLLDAEPIPFEDYEALFKSNENSVILECEIAGESTMLKYESDTFVKDTYIIKKGQGDYWSKVITPVRILKVHHTGSGIEKEFNVGDIIPYMEDYFKVTSDMEEVTDEYDVGTYISIKNYYPMMEGKRYVIYATAEEYEYRDICYDIMLFPYDAESSVCLDEESLHEMRRNLYSDLDIEHYKAIWEKYSNP